VKLRKNAPSPAALRLADCDNPAKGVVPKRIIALAKAGQSDPSESAERAPKPSHAV
jgi:hypothetical protein